MLEVSRTDHWTWTDSVDSMNEREMNPSWLNWFTDSKYGSDLSRTLLQNTTRRCFKTHKDVMSSNIKLCRKKKVCLSLQLNEVNDSWCRFVYLSDSTHLRTKRSPVRVPKVCFYGIFSKAARVIWSLKMDRTYRMTRELKIFPRTCSGSESRIEFWEKRRRTLIPVKHHLALLLLCIKFNLNSMSALLSVAPPRVAVVLFLWKRVYASETFN